MRETIEAILDAYAGERATPFSSTTVSWDTFDRLRKEASSLTAVQSYETLKVVASVGKGNWANVPWLALLDTRETKSAQRGVYCVFLFREDMSGVYLALTSGSAEPRKKEHIRSQLPPLNNGFRVDDAVDLGVSSTARSFAERVMAYKLYQRGNVPEDVTIEHDVHELLAAYRGYLEHRTAPADDRAAMVEELIDAVRATGFQYPAWLIAAYVAAVRTERFVILAGATGSGKSSLPRLVATATGSDCKVVAVRADWTDSSDVTGYVDQKEKFRPGVLVHAARKAVADPGRMHFLLFDEMNLARVEYYLPEFLSVIASRWRDEQGVTRTLPLFSQPLGEDDAEWNRAELPENLAIIGTVNMDEAGTGFSARVLDRAFTIEMPAAEPTEWSRAESYVPRERKWPVSAWRPLALDRRHLPDLTADENRILEKVDALLGEIDRCLVTPQSRCQHRLRNTVSLFALHAANIAASFRNVDPLDLAIHAKVLPRIHGGSAPVRLAVMQLLGMALSGTRFHDEREAGAMVQRWRDADCPEYLPEARLPFTAARLCLMWQRLDIDGETSFW
jgi:hypothetical protein